MAETEVQSLQYKVGMGFAAFVRGVRAVQGGLRDIQQTAKQTQDKFDRSADRMEQGLQRVEKAGYAVRIMLLAVMGALAAAATMGIRFDSVLEQANIGFTTMLKSGQAAGKFLRDLAAFAKRTPFSFTDLIQAAQRMLALGFSAKQILPVLTAVGDAAAALGATPETLQRIIIALGQIRAKGKLSAEEMMQLAESGIPAWQMVADKIGVSIPEAMKMAQNGAIDADTAISALTEGMEKRFGGMMTEQAKTMQGLWSNLLDSVEQATGKAFKPLFSVLKDLLKVASDFANSDDFQDWAGRVANALSVVVGWVKDGVTWFGHLSDEQKTQILRWIAMGGAVVAGVSALALVVTVAMIVTRALALMTGAVAFLASPLGIMIVLATALYTAWDQDWGGLQTKITGWADKVKTGFQGVSDWWTNSKLGQAIKDAWDDVVDIWESDELTLPEKTLATVKVVADTVVGLGKIAWDAGKDLLTRAWAWVKDQLGVGDHKIGRGEFETDAGTGPSISLGKQIRAVLLALIAIAWGWVGKGFAGLSDLAKAGLAWVADKLGVDIDTKDGVSLGEIKAVVAALISLVWGWAAGVFGATASLAAAGLAWVGKQVGVDVNKEDVTLGDVRAIVTALVSIAWGWITGGIDYVRRSLHEWLFGHKIGRGEFTTGGVASSLQAVDVGALVANVLAAVALAWHWLVDVGTDVYDWILDHSDLNENDALDVGDLALLAWAAVKLAWKWGEKVLASLNRWLSGGQGDGAEFPTLAEASAAVQAAWNSKVGNLIHIALGVAWAISIAQSLASAVLAKAGVAAATGKGAARYVLNVGKIFLMGTLTWDALPDSVKDDLVKKVQALSPIKVSDVTAKTFLQLTIGTVEWLAGALAVSFGQALADWLVKNHLWQKAGSALKYIGKGLPTLAAYGLSIGMTIAVVDLFLEPAVQQQIKDKLNARWQDIQDTWNAQDLTLTVKIAHIAFDLFQIPRDIGAALASGVLDLLHAPDWLKKWLEPLSDKELAAIQARSSARRSGVEGPVAGPPSMAQAAVQDVIAGIPRLKDAEDDLQDIADQFVRIERAKGIKTTLDDLKDFLALVVSESGLSAKVLHESMDNPARISDALSTTNDKLKDSIDLWDKLRAASKTAAEAAAKYKVPGLVAQFGPDSTVPAFKLDASLTGTDIANLTASGVQQGYLQIRNKFAEGFVPQGGEGDWFPALLASDEAVVPGSVWKRGIAALASWFKRHGAPGYAAGPGPGLEGLQAQIDAEGKSLSGLDRVLSGMGHTLTIGLMAVLNMIATVFEAIGRAILGDDKYQAFADAIDGAKAKAQQFMDALMGVGKQAQDTGDDVGDLADDAEAAATKVDKFAAGIKDAMMGAAASVRQSILDIVGQTTVALYNGTAKWGDVLNAFNYLLQSTMAGIFSALAQHFVANLLDQSTWLTTTLANITTAVSAFLSQAYVALVAFFWFLGPGAPLAAAGVIAAAIGGIAAVVGHGIRSLLGKPSTPNIGGGDTGGGGDQKRSRAGPAFAELAGPTRDLLVELLRPLTNLNILTGYWQQGLALLTQIRDNTAVLSAPSIASAMSVSPAGAGALAGPTIVFDLSRLTEPGYADAQIEAINRALGGVAKIQKRTGGGG